MAIGANGREYDITLIADSSVKTSTSQYMCVGFAPGSSTSLDRVVGICGAGGTLGDATTTADHCIGVNQSYLSSGSQECNVRLMGVSKVVCAESIGAGVMVMPYWGISTTTQIGRIVAVDNGVTVSSATHSISAQVVLLGRALESGSTGTVISVFVNPQLYDRSLVGTIGIT